MNTPRIKEKRIYICPVIVYVELDNEISLILESSPPEGPGETVQSTRNNPFKDSLGLV